MKSLLSLLALLHAPLLLAAVGSSDLQEIRRLVADGKYEEALEKHLWFHEESKTSPGMGGVRLSFALSQWLDLGKKYPRALEALKELRARNEAALLAQRGGFPEFHDCSAIDRTLGEKEKTYTLFTRLDSVNPEVAKMCFEVALDIIVEHRDFELCNKYLGDPFARYERLQQMRETNLRMAQTNANLNTGRFVEFADNSFKTKTVQLITVLAKSNRMADAREVQKRALSYFPTREIETALPASP